MAQQPEMPTQDELELIAAELLRQADEDDAIKRLTATCRNALTTSRTERGDVIAKLGTQTAIVAWAPDRTTIDNHARAALLLLAELGLADEFDLIMGRVDEGPDEPSSYIVLPLPWGR